MASKSRRTYTGVTNDLERRVFEHKHKVVKGFTERYNITRLVYFESFEYILDAIYREKQIKKWRRQWKVDLIEKDNPCWQDLSDNWDIETDTM